MTAQVLAGVLLIVLPIAYNAAFALLGQAFDYPDILRGPTSEVLRRFVEGGTPLVVLWWSFALTAVLLLPAVVVVSATLHRANGAVLSLATAVGVVAAVVQFLGLIRWPFVIPYLARMEADPSTAPGMKDAIEVTFQTLNRYLGVAVGEHLGYLFTGAWTALVGVALIQSSVLHPAFGVVGLVLAPLFLVGSLEFVGPFEPTGWPVAGVLVPIAYIGWSIWLFAIGVGLLITA